MRFFGFRLEIPFLGKFDPKIRNFLFKLKLVNSTDEYAEFNGGVYMKNPMMMFTFPVLNFPQQVFSKNFIWHFDATGLIPQQFTH